MAIPSVFVQLQKPIKANKKLFGLIGIAVILIGAIAAGYYFHIQNNQAHYKEFKLKMLDSYFNKISKKLEKDIISDIAVLEESERKAREKSNRLKKREQFLKFASGIFNLPLKHQSQAGADVDTTELFHKTNCLLKIKKNENCLKQLVDPLKLDEEFSDYIVIFDEVGKGKVQTSSLLGLHSFKADAIFASDTLSTGIIKTIKVNEEELLLIGRKYKFSSKVETDRVFNITLVGLINSHEYHKATRELNPLVIAFLCAFLILSLIGLPFFKLIFIAEDERLFRNDVIMAGISTVIGTAVITAVFLSVLNYAEDYYLEVPDELEELGLTIKNRFEAENRESVLRLNELDLDPYSRVQDSSIFIDPIGEDSRFRQNFKFISKIDDSATVEYHINLIQQPAERDAPQTLKDRNYFKDFKQNENRWLLKDDEKAVINYVMRPVVSIEKGEEEAVYMIKAKEKEYKVASVHLKSVHNPILPFGYQLAIVDELGEVWFHSEEGKSTLENLFEVSNKAESLQAAINGRISSQGFFKYHGDGRLYRSYPIRGTNLSLIVFYDLVLLRVKLAEIFSIACMGIILGFLVLGLVVIVVTQVKNPKWGLYKYTSFPFEFLTPKRKHRGTYAFLTLSFIGITLALLLISCSTEFAPSSAFLATLLLIVWVFAVVYFSLSNHKLKDYKKLRIQDYFLIVVLVILSIIEISTYGNSYKGLIVTAILQLIGVLGFFLFRSKKLRRRVAILMSKTLSRFNKPYRYWYAMFLMSWLFLSSVFPTYVFYTKSQTIEDEVWIKTNQYYVLEEYAKKEKLLMNDKLKVEPEQLDSYQEVYKEHLRKGMYLSTNYEFNAEDTLKYKANEKSYFRQLLWSTRPIYNDKVRNFQALVYREAHDGTWHSQENELEKSLTLQRFTQEGKSPSTKYNALKPLNNGLKRKLLFSAYILGAIIITLTLFLLILFYVDRFFGFRFMHLKANDFDSPKKQYESSLIEVLKNQQANSGIILIGMPLSGKKSFADRIVQESGYNQWSSISFLAPCDETEIRKAITLLAQTSNRSNEEALAWESSDIFIIQNLEHNLKSSESNRLKLKIISYLISLKKRIILTSEVYPSQILSFYKDQADELGRMEQSLASDYNSWRNILSEFPQLQIGITDKSKSLLKTLSQQEDFKHIPEEVIKRVVDELGFSRFLPTLAPIILSKSYYTTKVKGSKMVLLDDQRMILHTMNLSHGYYTDTWNSLPRRERYLLYDLAKDGFINIKNGNSLFSLMKKGIIVWRDRPAIFNQSFRNFVISSVSKTEALSIELKNRQEGSWGTIKVVFYLIIVTVIIFILLGEPGLLEDFETFYGALAGLGAIIPILSSFLSRSNKK